MRVRKNWVLVLEIYNDGFHQIGKNIISLQGENKKKLVFIMEGSKIIWNFYIFSKPVWNSEASVWSPSNALLNEIKLMCKISRLKIELS